MTTIRAVPATTHGATRLASDGCFGLYRDVLVERMEARRGGVGYPLRVVRARDVVLLAGVPSQQLEA